MKGLGLFEEGKDASVNYTGKGKEGRLRVWQRLAQWFFRLEHALESLWRVVTCGLQGATPVFSIM